MVNGKGNMKLDRYVFITILILSEMASETLESCCYWKRSVKHYNLVAIANGHGNIMTLIYSHLKYHISV